jgi:nitrate/TMAO reductase-like tetraheme cytochrome c subunit
VRPHPFVALATVVLGCLPAFAPNLRPRGVHAGLTTASSSELCMSCHISEKDALELGAPASAPIVADWMLAEERTCSDCHRVRGHEQRAARDHLPALAELGRAP